MKNDKTTTVVSEKIIVIVFLVSFFFVLASPVEDPDVFWHIKTGEWIWHHKSLPEADLFSYSVGNNQYDDHIRLSVILKQYWLSQLLLYGLHSIGGLYGIVLFRFLIYSALLGLLFFWMKKRDVHKISAFFFLVPLFLIVLVYGGERPNTLSYLLAVTVFYLTDEFSVAGDKKGLFLPVIVVAWSLMHGGFLLGEAILCIYLLVMLFRRITGNTVKSFSYKVVVHAVAIAAPFIFSESAWNTVKMMIYETSDPLAILYRNTVSETISPFASGSNIDVVAVLAFMILLLSVVIRGFSAEHLLLAFFLLAISSVAVRFLPFLLILMLPVIAFHWSARPSFDLNNKVFRYLMYSTILFSIIFMGQEGLRKSLFLNGVLNKYYPKDAVLFMKTVRPEGNVFNSYNWGGYLIYDLFPEKKVFIDPRCVSLPPYVKYCDVFDVTSNKLQNAWRDVFQEYHISLVLIPSFDKFEDKFSILVKKLVDDPNWSLIFVGRESAALIFIKSESSNSRQIRQYSLKKEGAFEKALEDMNKEPVVNNSWRRNWQMAVVNIFLKRYEAAETLIEKALDSNNKLTETPVLKILAVLKKGDYSRLDDAELYKIWRL